MMSRFYQPDLGSEPDSPFARDANDKLIRRSYWLDMNDRSLVLAMTQGLVIWNRSSLHNRLGKFADAGLRGRRRAY
jgi:hypothetical protein